jgi:hypothetical protein
MRFPPRSIFLKCSFRLLSTVVLALAPTVAVAQHGGGHGGGGHAGGGGFHPASAPRVAPAPRVSQPPAAAPRVIARSPRTTFVQPPSSTATQADGRAAIGYPSAWRGGPVAGSFNGQGTEMWRGQGAGQLHVGVGRPIIYRPIVGPGYGFYRGYPFYGGFFGPGFGWGGLGFGWGSTCGPYWGGGFGCNGLSYYDYGYDSGYASEPAVSNWPSSDYGSEPETPPPTVNGPVLYEPETPEQTQNNIRSESFITMLYFKDGSVYALNNYWVEDSKLHYLTTYGGENAIDLSLIDIQKTVDVNASRGVTFTLRPRPDAQPAGPGSPPPAAPEQPLPPAPPSTPPNPQP